MSCRLRFSYSHWSARMTDLCLPKRRHHGGGLDLMRHWEIAFRFMRMRAISWQILKERIRVTVITVSVIYLILLPVCPKRFMQILGIYYLREMKLWPRIY